MNPLLRSMALMTLCAAQAHAETSPRAPIGAPEPRDPLPRWQPTPPKPPPPPPPSYACPRCGAGASTPKRCRPCGVKMARRRSTL